MAKTYFVSRHEGAVNWAKKQQLRVDGFIDHLDTEDIQEGDTVIGTLPIALAFEVCRRKAHFFALNIKTPRARRGVELSAEQMDECECEIEEYRVMKV